MSSFIFYGESGIGKTTAATVIAKEKQESYDVFNPTIHSKKELLEKLAINKILIIDELHRLNKDKQEILLSYLEDDKIILYATTTENPYFKIIPSLRSRLKILRFNKLSETEIFQGLKNIIEKYKLKIKINDDLLLSIVKFSAGDFRNAINNLDLIETIYPNTNVDFESIKKIFPSMNFYTDKDADKHYDTLSAFHKSLRGSDPDAALYYGMLLAKAGDIDALLRRLIMVAYEDIALANPNASIKVDAAINAIERVGFPEANTILAKIIIEIALSPKSNSTYVSMNKILDKINNGNIYDIPDHLKDTHYKNSAKFNRPKYLYPHDFENNYVNQNYLPIELEKNHFFEFANNQNEQKIKSYWEKIKIASRNKTK
ncbi:ATPase [Mycoplasma mobile 163K]|uniref:ATPase n=2 Tax=[Mycoplasma] mobile TaxID=2118 RepID=Q6KHC7_MYCM1|nr:ATPase [Mycoplasma mobile 163K]